MKFIDYIVLRIIVFVLAFVITSLYIDNLWLSVAIAATVTLLASLLLDLITGGRHRRAYAAYADSLIFGGNSAVMAEVEKVTGLKGDITDNYLFAENKLVINAVKFGNVTGDEIIRYYRLQNKLNAEETYIIARHLDRKAMSVLNSVDASIIYIPLKRVYHLSKPEKTQNTKRRRRKISDAFRYALSRSNATKYLFTALVLGVMSIFTPLKTYYLVLSGVTALLAVLSLSPIGENSDGGKRGIFSYSRANKLAHKADNNNDIHNKDNVNYTNDTHDSD